MSRDNRMIYPPIPELTGDNHNRYELVIAVAKGARKVTDEYLEMRARAEKMIEDKETDKSILALIDAEYRDQKAVKIGIGRLKDGTLTLVRASEQAEATEEKTEAEE